jgi:hypothetical protein
MPFRPPLTHADLARIRARYELTPERAPCSYQDAVVWNDIVVLLREVARLRSMLLRAQQLRDRFPKPNSCLDAVWEEFVKDLTAEPCVLELGGIKEELTSVRRKRKPKT